MLELSGVNVHYGKIHVLRDVSLHVETGEVAALIGPNAAGKTTTLRALVGLKDCASGVIRFGTQPIQRLSRFLTISGSGRFTAPIATVSTRISRPCSPSFPSSPSGVIRRRA
jgi:ABC-type branched-subunit amino acid transport system ATPase component